jgi:tetratricopeptide (TPR) repeat protein
MGKHDQAIQDCEQTLELAPKAVIEVLHNNSRTPIDHLVLADAYFRENKLQEAKENLLKAQGLAENDPSLINNNCFKKLRDKVADKLKISTP